MGNEPDFVRLGIMSGSCHVGIHVCIPLVILNYLWFYFIFITCIDSSYIESSFDDDEEESLCSMNMSDPEFDEPTTDHEILQSGPFTTPWSSS